MKRNILIWVAAIGFTALTGACTNRDLERRVAELESRMDKQDAGKASQSVVNTANPTTAVTPNQPVSNEVKPEGPLPIVDFEQVDHDFGTVNEGQKVSYTYKLKNTGQAPLIIQSAQPSCGCTVPKWTQDPIPVGGSGFVTAEFDTNGKPGVNNKTITVTANTWPKTTTLRFKAMVTPKTDMNGPTK